VSFVIFIFFYLHLFIFAFCFVRRFFFAAEKIDEDDTIVVFVLAMDHDDNGSALCRRLNDVTEDTSPLSLAVPVQLQVVSDDWMAQKLRQSSSSSSTITTRTRRNNSPVIVIRKDDIHNVVLMKPTSTGLAALRRLSILYGGVATLTKKDPQHISQQPQQVVTIVLCMDDQTPDEKEQKKKDDRIIMQQEDEEDEDIHPHEDIYSEEHSYLQVDQPIIILTISSTLAATLGCAWSTTNNDATRTIHGFFLQEYICDYYSPALVLPKKKKKKKESLLVLFASEEESIPMAHIVTVGCLGCPVPLATSEPLVCPRPNDGILITEKCLLRVLDPISRQYFYYQVVHILSHQDDGTKQRDNHHRGMMYPRRTYRTTTETEYQFLDLSTSHNSASAACCRRLPPLPIIIPWGEEIDSGTTHTNNKNAEHYHYPHPDLTAVAQSLQSIAPTLSSPGERIFPLVGTDHEHDVSRLVETAAHLVGMRCLPVMGLAAFAARHGHPVTTGSIADQLEGLQIALNQAKKCAPCVLHLIDLDTEFLSQQQDPSLLEEHENRVWSLLMDALDPTRYQTTTTTTNGSIDANQTRTYYANSKFDETDRRWAPSLIIVISTTRRLARVSATGPLSQNLVYDALPLTQPDTAFANFLWEECDRLYHCSGNKLRAKDIQHDLAERPLHDIRILYELWRRFLTSANTIATKEQEIEEFRKICNDLDRQRRTQGSKSSSSVATIANVKWEDVGGLAQVRKEIMDTIELPLQYPQFFPHGGRSGILLYGK
jgi:hypothetical protein